MKQTFNYLAVLLAGFMTSCSSETLITQDEMQRVVQQNKTVEMLRFEETIKEWSAQKRLQNKNTAVADTAKTTDKTVDFLRYLGTAEVEIQQASKTTDELMIFAIKQYAQKLSQKTTDNVKLKNLNQ